MTLPILIGLNLVLIALGVVLFQRYRAKSAHITVVIAGEKRRLSAMIASLTDGVLMIDNNLDLVVANPAALRLLDLTRDPPEDSSEPSLEKVVSVLGSKANLRGAITQALSTQSVITLPEFTLSGRYLEVGVEPVRDSLGNKLGVVVVIRDLTSAKQLEKMHSDFTAMMIHELRTPLTTVLYSTTMLISDLPKLAQTEIAAQIEIIKSTSSHLLSLVNDLLDVSKIEAGRFQVVKQSGNLLSLIEEKVAAFTPLAQQKELKVTTKIDASIGEFPFDQNRIGQVLDNLLSNAIKYTSRGGVEIKLVVEGSEVRVEMEDSGDGISQEDQQKLFSKFQQLGRGKDGSVRGTGLGLVVVKGIVEAHGGKVWARSGGVGQGSTFGFSLPLG